MRVDVLSCLHLAQQLLGIAADAIVMYFQHLDLAGRIDDEGAAQRQALLLDHDLKISRQGSGRVANQRVLNLADRI